MAFGGAPTIWTLRGNKENYVDVFVAETTTHRNGHVE